MLGGNNTKGGGIIMCVSLHYNARGEAMMISGQERGSYNGMYYSRMGNYIHYNAGGQQKESGIITCAGLEVA